MARVEVEEFRVSNEIITLRFAVAIKVDVNSSVLTKVLAEEGIEWDRQTAINGVIYSINNHLSEIATNSEDIKVGVDCRLLE